MIAAAPFDRLPWWPDTVVIIAACIGAVASLILNAIASRQHPKLLARRRLAMISGISSLYVVAYMVLILGPFSVGDWSRFIRIVNIVPWVLVWPAWAVTTIRAATTHKDPDTIELLAGEIERQVDERTKAN